MRAVPLIAMMVAIGAITAPILINPPLKLVWNASSSVPRGLYAIHNLDHPIVDDVLAILPSAPLADWLDDRRYIPKGTPLLKSVAALEGQRVCRSGLTITIDRKPVAQARHYDRQGRPLPRWQGCQTVKSQQVFLLNADHPDSLDGRYFKALSTSVIIGRAIPIWIVEQ